MSGLGEGGKKQVNREDSGIVEAVFLQIRSRSGVPTYDALLARATRMKLKGRDVSSDRERSCRRDGQEETCRSSFRMKLVLKRRVLREIHIKPNRSFTLVWYRHPQLTVGADRVQMDAYHTDHTPVLVGSRYI